MDSDNQNDSYIKDSKGYQNIKSEYNISEGREDAEENNLEANKTAADRTTADRTAADRTAADKTAADKTAADKTAADITAADKTAADRTAADKTAADKTAADKVAADKVASSSSSSLFPSGRILFSNTLKGLVRIVNSKGNTPQAFKDSQFRKYWMLDKHCTHCYDCGAKFSFILRKHHCRICGQIFCSNCSNKEVPGTFVGFTGSLRSCNYCSQVVQQYVRDNEICNIPSLNEDSNQTPNSSLITTDPNVNEASNSNNTNTLANFTSFSTTTTPSSSSTSSPANSSNTTNASLLFSANRRAGERKIMNLSSAKNKFFPTKSGVNKNGSSGSFDRRCSDYNPIRSSIFDEDSDKPELSYKNASSVEPYTTEKKLLLQKSMQLKSLWLSMVGGLATQQLRYKLKTYDRCMLGSNVVDWLLQQHKASSRKQACLFGQALMDSHLMQAVDSSIKYFVDDNKTYFRPSTNRPPAGPKSWRKVSGANEDDVSAIESDDVIVDDDNDLGTEPLWVKNIQRNADDDDDDDDDMANNNIVNDGDEKNSDAKSQQSCNLERKSTFYIDHPLKSPLKCEQIKDEVTDEDDSHICPLYPEDNSYSVDEATHTPTTTGTNVTDTNNTSTNTTSASSDIIASITSTVTLTDHVTGKTPAGQCDHDVIKRELKGHLSRLCDELISRQKISVMWKDVIVMLAKNTNNKLKTKGETTNNNNYKNNNNNINDNNNNNNINNNNNNNDININNNSNNNNIVAAVDDEMDVCSYVKIKKILSSKEIDECEIVDGVVMTKNVTHRKMRSDVTNPKILLLATSLEYQRVENKFSSLEPQILQEREFLKKSVERILQVEPDVVIVEKSVSRLANEFLFNAGVTVVSNVKPDLIRRISRMLQTNPVSSIDGLVSKSALGTCQRFYVKSFPHTSGKMKTLMYLDGCLPKLGCSVILKGSSLKDLRRVKLILKFAIFAINHMNFELSYLMDVHAGMPASRTTTHDDEVSTVGNDVHISNRQPACDGSTEVSALHTEVSALHTEVSALHTEGGETVLKGDDGGDDDLERRLRKMQKYLKDGLLSISPHATFYCPYLELSACQGFKGGNIGSFLTPPPHFWSKILSNDGGEGDDDDVGAADADDDDGDRIQRNLPHVFLQNSNIGSVNGLPFQNMVADYRARGGTLSYKEDVSPYYFSSNPATKQPKHLDNDVIALSSSSNRQQQQKQQKQQFIDCMDVLNHQNITLLFSSISSKSGNYPQPCICPWEVTMKYYSGTDISLGGFLDQFCFSDQYRCISFKCGSPIRDHVRKFVHHNGCIQVTMKSIDANAAASSSTSSSASASSSSLSSLQVGCSSVFGGPSGAVCGPGGAGSSECILMWSCCLLCFQKVPVTVMSPETYNMSFGKYLELRFYADAYVNQTSSSSSSSSSSSNAARCSHSLHHHYIQFFDWDHLRVAFKYTPVKVLDMNIPDRVIELLSQQQTKQLEEHLIQEGLLVKERLKNLFESIVENLSRMKKDQKTSNRRNHNSNDHNNNVINRIIEKAQAATNDGFNNSNNNSDKNINNYLNIQNINNINVFIFCNDVTNTSNIDIYSSYVNYIYCNVRFNHINCNNSNYNSLFNGNNPITNIRNFISNKFILK
ncbi:hypothetical protein HELRODRAFT_190147 [Helobdella robusta]|uniref:1-phosphatidylinositol-3-phosphate 5-kinase n=1 Tax=Helobdella robusta TaxID=6412 RepID=T1FRQ7_HELRO|nr:hypothetical protein HELRODRAFT_190147 [Helobdella robusta]ESO10728.1 hypothetical protein HELRODRAFT_190147 [Helobdella robusta]